MIVVRRTGGSLRHRIKTLLAHQRASSALTHCVALPARHLSVNSRVIVFVRAEGRWFYGSHWIQPEFQRIPLTIVFFVFTPKAFRIKRSVLREVAGIQR